MTYGSLRKRSASALRTKAQASIEPLENRALMSAGDLDVNWGHNGIVLTDFGNSANGRGELAMAVAIQANGRIVSAGQSSDSFTGQQVFAVSRHFADGDLDTSFGNGGTVLTEFASGANSLATAVAIDSQQRIIVAGRSGLGAGDVLSVARYLPNGSLDTSFQNDGTATFTGLADGVIDLSLVIDGDDRPLIGYTSSVSDHSDMAIVRLNVNGFIDSSFGDLGRAVSDVTALDRSGGIAIDAEGNIVQAGVSFLPNQPNGFLFVTRFNSQGARDTAGYGNGTGSLVSTSTPMDTVNSVMVDIDGSLLLAGTAMGMNPSTGSTTGIFNLARIAADGSGITKIAQPGLQNDSLQWSMGMQRDGKIIVAGDNFSFDTFEQKYVIARFNGQLELDTPFGDSDGTADGMYISPMDPAPGTSIVSDSEGQILIVGNAIGEADSDFLLARHDSAMVDGPPVVTADANARENDAPYAVSEMGTLTLKGAGSVTASSGGITFNQSQRRATAETGSSGQVNYAWDLDGDGEFDDSFVAEPVLNGSALDGPSTITVGLKVTDASNANNFAIDTAQVQVNNIAPQATINLPTSAREGEAVTITATIVDAPRDTHTYAWTVTQGSNVMTGTSPSFTFTPSDNGDYTVALTVHDDDGAQVTAQQKTLSVANVNPTATIHGGTATVAEGGTVSYTSEASDVDADPLSYHWNVIKDGDAYLSVNTKDFTFIPDNNGVYQVSFTVTDGDGGSATSESSQVTVTNVAPTAEASAAGDAVGVRGQNRKITFSATDPGAADVTAGFTYTVDWGDGTPVQTFQPGATAANHAYLANGTFTAKVTAKDQDNALSPTVNVTMVTQSAELENGILNVSGSTGSDKIRLTRTGNNIEVRINDIVGTGGAEYVQNYNAASINRIVVLAQAGDDKIEAETMTVSMEIYGGDGDDKIDTGGGADIVVGGNGNDKIVGGGGARDILIGGRGEDKVQGDNGDDIIVGGYTLHDADMIALRSISAEWNSSRSYQDRIDRIRGTVGGGLNAGYILKADVTSFDDGAVDNLTGGNGRDWFFFNVDKATGKDKITDAAGNEIQDEVDMQP